MSITFLLFFYHYFLKDEKKNALVVRKWSRSVSGALTVLSYLSVIVSFLVKIMVILLFEGANFPVSQFSSVHAHGCVN